MENSLDNIGELIIKELEKKVRPIDFKRYII